MTRIIVSVEVLPLINKSDNESKLPWREKPGIVGIEFNKKWKVIVAPKQPDFILVKNNL